MRTLRRSIGKAEVGGEPLPPAFAAFQRAGIILRRAEITMIAGTPGAGKSSVALAIAAKAKVPTLYFSADTRRQRGRGHQEPNEDGQCPDQRRDGESEGR